jgi:hypothetical protein
MLEIERTTMEGNEAKHPGQRVEQQKALSQVNRQAYIFESLLTLLVVFIMVASSISNCWGDLIVKAQFLGFLIPFIILWKIVHILFLRQIERLNAVVDELMRIAASLT